MIDIDKVIKGLTQCTSVNTQTKCHACPYWGSKDGFSDCDGMKADALKLLKEQQAEISFLKAMQLKTVHNMGEQELGEIVKDVLGRW